RSRSRSTTPPRDVHNRRPALNGSNSQTGNAIALLPARIGSPRQKRGNLPNGQSSVVGLHKDWCSWPNKGHPR
ncbi:hypothetical protein A2U01_0106506, partial [Trifolium medium]|nr:hypothetical protein [Trifolium medium]